MKRYPWLLLIILVLHGLVAQAQDAIVSDDTYLLYYEDERPNQLDILLLGENICLEAVILHNPDLDINAVAYGTPIWIPRDQPCYDYDKARYGWWNFSDGSPPRLKYYENGQWLAEPYYSDSVVYTNAESLDLLSQKLNVCVDALLADNYLLQDFDAYNNYAYMSMDVFIPREAPPCYPIADVEQAEPLPDLLNPFKTKIRVLSPSFFVERFNICVENVPWLSHSGFFYNTTYLEGETTVYIPVDYPPCYNGQGQRLRYYDNRGRKLEKPVYSDLPVYVAPPGAYLEHIAQEKQVCLIDLLTVNRFPDMPARTEIELFIPTSLPCPPDLETRQVKESTLREVSRELNICAETIARLNPHLNRNVYAGDRTFYSPNLTRWVIVPTAAEPCYEEYHPIVGLSIYEFERQLNICQEEFIWNKYVEVVSLIPHENVRLYIRHDVPPCYNSDGQRLRYSQGSRRYDPILQKPKPVYTDMQIYSFQPGDTVYSISRQFNVCVEDLLRENIKLQSSRPLYLPVFIPNTRPCYDEASGKRLIYEAEAGNPLPEPRFADQLIYYGSQPFGRVSYYYNVCINRIEDANRDKLNREQSYLGWIIPTNRPPCYDHNGVMIEYVCYNQPIDFTVNYRNAADDISFDIDGTYCYDLAKPETVVWYKNKPYQFVKHWENSILKSRAFMAWCFGVSLDEINAINADPEMLAMLPYYTRAIPRQTRECYVQNPHVLASAKTIHIVQMGETVTTIAARYDMWPHWIAQANDLDEENMIWAGQSIIIPDGLTVRGWILMRCAVVGLAALCGLVYVRRQKSLVIE